MRTPPPRILLVSSNSSEAGGGERYLDYLAQGFLAIGCDVHALLSTHAYMDGWAAMLQATGATVHREPLDGLRHRPLRFLQSLADIPQQRRIERAVRRLRPSAVLVNMQYDEDGLDYFMGAARAGVPVAATLHMPMAATKDRRPLGRLRGHALRAWYRRHRPRLLLVSDGSRREWEAYYRVPGLCTVVHHGIPWPGELPVAPPADAPPARTIGFVGRLDPQKNVPLLVRAFAALHRRQPTLRLLLVGDGVDRPRVEAAIARARLPSAAVEIAGWVPDPERAMQRIDLLAMTSDFEGLPLALLEAAGRGMPCVVTPFNGADDVAARAPWVRVAPSHHPRDVARALASALRDHATLRLQAAQGVPAFRDHFSLQRMARETLGLLLREKHGHPQP